jgi:hypothetical protein
VDSAADPPRSLVSVFSTGAATFLSSSASFILTRAEWTPTDLPLIRKSGSAGTSGLAARNSDH